MKKLLALLLALTMAVSLFTVAHANDVTPNSIQSITMLSDTYIKIEFAKPLASFNGAVLLGVLNADNTNWAYTDGLATTAAMTVTLDDGALICTLTSDKKFGEVNYGKNLVKIMDAVAETYSGLASGIMIMENANAADGVTVYNSGYLEEVVAEDGSLLAKTATRTGNNRDVCAHPMPTVLYNAPTITSVVATSDTTFTFTTSEPIKVSGTGWSLFLEKDGKVNGIEAKVDRYGGDISPTNVCTNKFTWTITEKDCPSATAVITAAISNGYKVYLGMNGRTTNGVIVTDRAGTEDGRGFLPNLNLNHESHSLYGVEVETFVPNTIQSVTTTSHTELEITFAYPVVSLSGSVLLGVLNEEKTNWVEPMTGLAATSPLNVEIKDGKLVCSLAADKTVDDVNYGKNLTKIIEAITAEYGADRAGIMIMENSIQTGEEETTAIVYDSGYLEEVVDEYGRALQKTAVRTSNKRDVCAHTITLGEFGEAKLGDKMYETLADAMENAKADDTIVLMDNVTVADPFFILDAGVTLDLSGYTLTMENYLLPYGTVMDSAVENKGKLVVDADKVLGSDLDSEEYMPLYNDAVGGYQFYKYTFRHVEKNTNNDDTVMYSVGLKFDNDEAFTLLSGKKFGVKMTIDKADANFAQDITWIFSENLMNDFIVKNTDDDGVKNAITLTVSGVKAIGKDCISTQAVLYSMDGMLNLECAMDEPVA